MAQFLLTALSHMFHNLYGAKNIEDILLDDERKHNISNPNQMAQHALKHKPQLLEKQNALMIPNEDESDKESIKTQMHRYTKHIKILSQQEVEINLETAKEINPTTASTIAQQDDDKKTDILSEIKDLIKEIHNDNNKYSNDKKYRTSICNYLIEREQQLETLHQISLEHVKYLEYFPEKHYDSTSYYSGYILFNYFQAAKDQLFMMSKNIDNKELVESIIEIASDYIGYMGDLYQIAHENDNKEYASYVHQIINMQKPISNIPKFHINISKVDKRNIIHVFLAATEAMKNNIYQNLNKHVTSTKITSEYPWELMYDLMDKYNPEQLNNNIPIINKLKTILSETQDLIEEIHHNNNVDQDNETDQTNIFNYLIEKKQQLETLYQILLAYIWKQYCYQNGDSISYYLKDVVLKYFEAEKNQLFMISKNIKNKELVESIINTASDDDGNMGYLYKMANKNENKEYIEYIYKIIDAHNASNNIPKFHINTSKLDLDNFIDVLLILTIVINKNIQQNLSKHFAPIQITNEIRHWWESMYMLLLKYNPNEDNREEKAIKIEKQIAHNQKEINALSNTLSKLSELKKDIGDNFRKFENLPKPIFESLLDKNKINNNRNKTNDYIKQTLIFLYCDIKSYQDPITVTKDFTKNKYIIITPESTRVRLFDKDEAENHLMELVTEFSTELENKKDKFQKENKYLKFLWSLNENVKYEDSNIDGDKHLKREEDNRYYFQYFFDKYINS